MLPLRFQAWLAGHSFVSAQGDLNELYHFDNPGCSCDCVFLTGLDRQEEKVVSVWQEPPRWRLASMKLVFADCERRVFREVSAWQKWREPNCRTVQSRCLSVLSGWRIF